MNFFIYNDYFCLNIAIAVLRRDIYESNYFSYMKSWFFFSKMSLFFHLDLQIGIYKKCNTTSFLERARDLVALVKGKFTTKLSGGERIRLMDGYLRLESFFRQRTCTSRYYVLLLIATGTIAYSFKKYFLCIVPRWDFVQYP